MSNRHNEIMKRITIKTVKILSLILLLVVVGVLVYACSIRYSELNKAKDFVTGAAPTLNENSISYRDLNKNGKLDIYEDKNAPIDNRVEDLLSQMTIEEKSGQLFQPFLMTEEVEILPMKIISYIYPPEKFLHTRRLSHITSPFAPDDAREHIKWTNRVQTLAEQTRLGIPVSISSDPRHSDKKGAAIYMKSLSQFPDATGLGALRDSLLTYKFAQIAAREYRAIGITTSLSPTADLATEPRWGRIAGTFGENAEVSAKLTAAYIKGMQGDSLTSTSVSTMTKHFSGGGPQLDGEDAHFKYGKEQIYPGDNFAYHVIPFRAAIKAGTAQMMPYYGIPMGQTNEDVGFAFNKEIITDLLKDSLNYKGIICSDWGVLNDPSSVLSKMATPMDHGVEDLDMYDQAEKALNAGIDQFGGNDNPEIITKLVKDGRISEARLDRSVRKLLKQKFQLGLFDNPYLDENTSLRNLRRPEDVLLGMEAMMRSSILLKNEGSILPLKPKTKVYIENLDQTVAGKHFTLVLDPKDADIAILQLDPPFTPRDGFLEGLFHSGRLTFTDEEIDHIQEIAKTTPVIFTTYLERATIFPEINKAATAVLVHFSISDEALMNVLSGKSSPEGKLPFELPSSEEAVAKQLEDVPHDSENPLYHYGFGLTYKD